MAISAKKITELLEQKFSDAEIILEDLVGDQDHYKLKIISSLFENKNTITQHRMIYEALGVVVGNELHAISIESGTPKNNTIL